MTDETRQSDGGNTAADSRKRGLCPPWKPGQSGNPAGAPKGLRISTCILRVINMTKSERAKFAKRKNLVGAEELALKWYKKMSRVNDATGPKLLDMAMDRSEGKVKEVHKIEGLNDRRALSPEEIDLLWSRRQSRQTKK